MLARLTTHFAHRCNNNVWLYTLQVRWYTVHNTGNRKTMETDGMTDDRNLRARRGTRLRTVSKQRRRRCIIVALRNVYVIQYTPKEITTGKKKIFNFTIVRNGVIIKFELSKIVRTSITSPPWFRAWYIYGRVTSSDVVWTGLCWKNSLQHDEQFFQFVSYQKKNHVFCTKAFRLCFSTAPQSIF